MAARPPAPQHSRFVHFVLPWIVAAAAFGAFLVTLNPWLSFQSLSPVAKVSGWDWMDSQLGPAVWLLTAPLRLLPEASRPWALNLLAALAGAGTLGLLAKCVALLPHDRTREQRQRERSDYGFLSLPLAWAPPVAAALFCGLQVTFWEHATAFTGEMLNLFLFAVCVFCVLRARVDGGEEGDRWWLLLAFLAPLAATGNWGMLGFLPGFLIAAVWIKGLTFFEGRFLTRAMLGASAGLLFYLFPPLLQKLRGNEAGLFQLLMIDLGLQRALLMNFPKYVVLIAGLTSLLPVLLMGIRWPSTFSDLNAAGAAVTNALFRIIHAAFLAACAWVAFDPPFSARALAFGVPFLPLYFLGALSLGYFAGYLLLLLAAEPQGRAARASASALAAGRAAAWVLAAALLGAGAFLGARNLPALRAQNSAAAGELGDRLIEALPASAAVVLSDEPALRQLAQASLARRRPGHGLLLLDTWLLPYHAYQQHLARSAGPGWPELALERLPEPLPDLTLIQQLAALAMSNRLAYLHPSFGAYFEAFRAVPLGVAFELVLRRTNDPVLPRLPAAEIMAARRVWDAARERLAALPPLAEGAPAVPDAPALRAYHGRALNTCGVWLQRHGETAAAGQFFSTAARLDTNNVFAAVNRDFNLRLAAPPATSPPVALRTLSELPARFRDWRTTLAYSGPADEPGFLFTLGAILSQGGLEQQAAELYARTHELRPDALEPAVALVGALTRTRRGPDALALLADLRRTHAATLTTERRDELSRLEAFAHLQTGDVDTAERLLLAAADRPGGGNEPLYALIQVYLQAGRLTNAAQVAQRLAAATPGDSRPLVTQSGIQIALEDHAGAVRLLTPVLERETNNIPALVNRAIALNRLGRVDDAARDYRRLIELAPALHGVWFHLGELDFQRKDFRAARRNFQRFLEGVPPESEEAHRARARLEEMAGKPGG